MTTDPTPIIAETHRIYCSLTRSEPNLAVWQRRLYDFVQAGYSPQDMEQVLMWLIRENKRNTYQRSLSLLKLMDLEHFDSYLVDARAANRNFRPVTPKAQVLAQLRPSVDETDSGVPARIIGRVMEDMRKGNVKI